MYIKPPMSKPKPKLKPKCKAPRKGGGACNFFQVEDNQFCTYHQYMKNYTEEQMQLLEACSGCKKMYYGLDGKQCAECYARPKKPIVKDETRVKCKYANCKCYIGGDLKYKDYCKQHQRHAWATEQRELGNKLCSQYIRGCTNLLPADYDGAKCQSCRDKYNAADIRRHQIKKRKCE